MALRLILKHIWQKYFLLVPVQFFGVNIPPLPIPAQKGHIMGLSTGVGLKRQKNGYDKEYNGGLAPKPPSRCLKPEKKTSSLGRIPESKYQMKVRWKVHCMGAICTVANLAQEWMSSLLVRGGWVLPTRAKTLPSTKAPMARDWKINWAQFTIQKLLGKIKIWTVD